MKTHPLSIATGVVLLVVFILLVFVFQVRQTEVAIVTTFGKTTSEKTEAGPYFRWPWPFQMVYKLDKRVRSLETGLQQSNTSDQFGLTMITYAGWNIGNAAEFFPRFDRGNYSRAESALKEMLLNAQKQALGRIKLSELINTNINEARFTELENAILKTVQEQCEKQKYGIEVKFVGIKRLGVPPGNTGPVLERMRSERLTRVRTIEAKGAAEASNIRNAADIAAREKITAANAEATRIEGAAQQEAAATLKVFEQEPQLAQFLLQITSLEAMLKDEATIIIPPHWPLMNLLNPSATQQKAPLTPTRSTP